MPDNLEEVIANANLAFRDSVKYNILQMVDDDDDHDLAKIVRGRLEDLEGIDDAVFDQQVGHIIQEIKSEYLSRLKPRLRRVLDPLLCGVVDVVSDTVEFKDTELLFEKLFARMCEDDKLLMSVLESARRAAEGVQSSEKEKSG